MSSQAGFLKTRSLPAAAALLLVLLAGCVISPRRDGTGTTPAPPPGTNPGKLYVTNEADNTILRFDNALTATGDQTPAATISNSSQISTPQYLLIDSANDRLYVAVSGAVLVYDNASTRTGGVAASRVISGLASPTDLALDRVHDQLYVTDGGNILVIGSASTANGTATPVRTISPLSPGAAGFTVAAIFLDTGGDRLYVADSQNSAVNIYDTASKLSGSVNAARALTGANTQLANPQGLQVDTLGRLIVANNSSGSITIYTGAAGVTGNTAPSAIITSPAANMAGPSQIFLSTGNELYVADGTAGGVPIFSGVNSANGNIVPARDIAGSHTTLSRANAGSRSTARGVALDPTR